MTVARALIVPVAGLLTGLGLLIGGRAGRVLLVVGTAAFGAACVLTVSMQ